MFFAMSADRTPTTDVVGVQFTIDYSFDGENWTVEKTDVVLGRLAS